MKNNYKYLALAVFFVVLMIIATLGYRTLSEKYDPQALNTIPSTETIVEESETSSETQAPTQLTYIPEVEDIETQKNPEEGTENSEVTTDEPESDTPSIFDSAKTTPAVDFSVQDANGNTVSLSDFYGKPIIINFWATWCGPCKRELPAFNNMHAKYGNDVQFMMVNLTDGSVDTVDGVKSFVSDNGYSFPLFLDVEYQCMGAYSISGIPRTIFIASDGNIVYEQVGAISEENLELYTQGLINYN